MSESEQTPLDTHIERTVDVVSAYVANNSIPTADLPALIASVHEALTTLAAGAPRAEAETVERPTAAQIRKSIKPDGLISFIDGKSYKTLKRHLTKHGLDPHSYRERFGLPADYPTTSANYSAQRSALAKSLGLGQPGRAAGEAEPQAQEAAAEAAQESGGRRRGASTGGAASKGRGSRKTAAAA
ncbi:MucR family transcriptional regulator [Methylobacterium nigriterrae]|uniref:MucR family transcriptional regulator n=1 Tax=Methylobacterium nigriterrae TaxID=3127512 RepID=UPI003013FC3D